jgi:hypothetical protein
LYACNREQFRLEELGLDEKRKQFAYSASQGKLKKRERKKENVNTYTDMILDDLGARGDEFVQVSHVELAVLDDRFQVAALVFADVVVQRIEVLGRVERIDADPETVGFGPETEEVVLGVPEVVDEGCDADGEVEEGEGVAEAGDGHFGLGEGGW